MLEVVVVALQQLHLAGEALEALEEVVLVMLLNMVMLLMEPPTQVGVAVAVVILTVVMADQVLLS
jgi:hypothetical protein